jgi:hypothetical protein
MASPLKTEIMINPSSQAVRKTFEALLKDRFMLW